METMISIYYRGNIHIINKEPFENIEDTYKRGWYIIKTDGKTYDEKYSKSIMMINKTKGMSY